MNSQGVNSKKQVKIGAILSYVSVAFNMILGVIYTPWMINKIGRSEYGIYGVAMSIISLCTMDFGLGQAVTRFISKYLAQNKEDSLKKFLGTSIKAYIILDIIISIVLVVVYFFIENIYISFTAEELDELKHIYIILIITSAVGFPLQILNGILNANEEFIFQKSIDILTKTLVVFSGVAVLCLNGELMSLVIVNSAFSIISAFIKLLYSRKNGLIRIDFSKTDRKMIGDVFSFSMWITTILILQRMILNIMPTILGITSGSSEVAVFSMGVTIHGYTYSLTGAISGLFMARVTKYKFSNRHGLNDIEELMIKVGRIQVLVLGAILSVFLITGKEFVLLWLGNQFSDTFMVALLIMIPLIFISSTGIAETYLNVEGKLRYETYAIAVTALASSLLSFLWSKECGAVGAAAGLLVGYVIGSVAMMSVIYSRVLHLRMKRYYVECLLKMSPAVLTTIIFGLIVKLLLTRNNWISLLIKCLILICIYFISFWLLEANKYEKELICSFCGRIMKNERD